MDESGLAAEEKSPDSGRRAPTDDITVACVSHEAFDGAVLAVGNFNIVVLVANFTIRGGLNLLDARSLLDDWSWKQLTLELSSPRFTFASASSSILPISWEDCLLSGRVELEWY
jgi:hypothetical protein